MTSLTLTLFELLVDGIIKSSNMEYLNLIWYIFPQGNAHFLFFEIVWAVDWKDITLNGVPVENVVNDLMDARTLD
jgi:hypothetical protein